MKSGQGLTWGQKILTWPDLDLAIYNFALTWPDLDLAQNLDLRSQVSDLGQVFSNSAWAKKVVVGYKLNIELTELIMRLI